MHTIEATGAIDAQGQLTLDHPLQVTQPGRVRVIVLITESQEQPVSPVNPDLANRPHSRPIWERVADISAQVPLEEWETLPKDLSKNLDHYLYGCPKEDA
jgi:hypothetical protein